MSKIIFIGDSITKGTAYGGVTTTDTFAYKIGVANGYAPADIINAGVNGDTTAGVLARLNADVISQSPAVCSVMIGINDWQNGVALTTYKNNLRAIVNALLAASIKPVLMSSVMQRGSTAQIDGYRAYLEAMEALAYELNVRYLGVTREYAYSYLYLTSSGFNALYVDVVHQTPAGHTFVANLAARYPGYFI